MYYLLNPMFFLILFSTKYHHVIFQLVLVGVFGNCVMNWRYERLGCGAVRCGAVRCGAVRCGAVRCGAVHCGGCGAVRFY